MRVRREVNRIALNSDVPSYLVEVAPNVAKYIIEKNNNNEAILEHYENKSFYLTENRFADAQEIKVTPLTHTTKREKIIRETQIFC